MKIKTITCHEVYNHGASLQEYALLKYLECLGHEAETINYKPDYLSNHFNFWDISNPKYNKPVIKTLYLLLKIPERLLALKRYRSFDMFSDKHINSTTKLYRTNADIKKELPSADAYICGSDQIWNSFFENGKDPAFYLDFVPDNKLKIAYAASFAIDYLDNSIKDFVKEKVSRIDFISVRESSGNKILEDLGIKHVTQVLDPVFLLDSDHWKTICAPKQAENYIFVYDCDSDPLIHEFVKKLQRKSNYKIITINRNIKYADQDYSLEGPDVFLSLIKNAEFIVSNSFHAVAFSIIFKKQFTVFNRFEKINTRMRDVVQLLDIPKVLIENIDEIENYNFIIDYNKMNHKLLNLINHSKDFLNRALNK